MTTALYRRYRPDSFEDVIGQEHVTVPLMTALSKDRVNHAYLFSGPRGCGKTTSARVLARCLNCAEGPTPNPCGVCESCRELATGGPGALDVIEIDAASHGGVDDARDLRERATFAPVRDRYKIFIIDEAHMVTSAGFNALLKIVEEPPPHIKFIFATTEPDKVIGTIRSRTHHYPFRLVPPEPLMEYLERLCVQEGVDVEPGVLSLVIRSGGGSVRDTLSVLDQLMAGAAEGRIGYDLAVNLLGYTPGALLDDVVDAVAAADSQTVFRVVDRVVQSGQDPRRFVEDLLERFRDLVIVKAMPDSASSVLHGMPEDQVRRLEAQAAQLGAGEISRAADITNHALTEMVGATSPRLHLELLMARLMLPSSDVTERGLAARLDRIERRLAYGGAPEAPDGGAPAQPGPSGGAGAPPATPGADSPRPGDAAAGGDAPSAPGGLSGAALARAAMRRGEASAASPSQAGAEPSPAPAASPAAEVPASPARPQAAAPSPDWGGGWGIMPEPARPAPSPSATAEPGHAPSTPEPSGAEQSAAGPSQAASAPEPSAAAPSRPEAPRPGSAPQDGAAAADRGGPLASGRPGQEPPAGRAQASQSGAPTSQVEMIRRAWPEILAYLEEHSRLVWMVVSQNASVAGFDGQLLTIGFSSDSPRDTVQRRRGDQVIAEAVNAVLGIQPRLDLITGGSAPAGGPGPKAEGRPTPAAPRPEPTADAPARPAPAPSGAPAGLAPGGPDASPAVPPPRDGGPAPALTAPGGDAGAASRPVRPGEPGRPTPSSTAPGRVAEASPSATPAAPSRGSQASAAPSARTAEDTPEDDGPGSEPVVEGATGPGTPPPPEDLGADDVPVSDWYGEEPHDDEFPPPPEDDEDEPADAGVAARPWGQWAVPGREPGSVGIPRPEPGQGGIPAFARPEAELLAEFEARRAGRGSGPSAASAPDAGSPAAPDPSGTPHHRRASRFQQMMEQYQRTQEGGRPPVPGEPSHASGPAGPGPDSPGAPGPGGPSSGPGTGSAAAGPGGTGRPGGSVDWTDDVPSEDDVTIEESGMAGRKVVERLLGARLVEERMLDGSPLS
ncbi:DNA polymerase III subunit gamma and tau [Citricoccus sp. SGAir0253]|uniref:DNA polymerase III subunit gamma and tau n=1 Tax=Citricoccus sp. SGAir0253 TaxID=2567881 RepID=UPI0010CD5906|nr:DNA polymerase III subunit gamma and tau [Citricoccus sp. SGAir0253]QCU79025.1 DNA polymerase III subunit gamma and tau [Citricoccus sp. SGAir0253]